MVDSKYSYGMVNQIVSSNKYLTRSPLQSTVADGDTCHPIKSSADTRSPSVVCFSSALFHSILQLVSSYISTSMQCLSQLDVIVHGQYIGYFFLCFHVFFEFVADLVFYNQFLSRFQNKQSLGNYHNRIIHVQQYILTEVIFLITLFIV